VQRPSASAIGRWDPHAALLVGRFGAAGSVLWVSVRFVFVFVFAFVLFFVLFFLSIALSLSRILSLPPRILWLHPSFLLSSLLSSFVEFSTPLLITTLSSGSGSQEFGTTSPSNPRKSGTVSSLSSPPALDLVLLSEFFFFRLRTSNPTCLCYCPVLAHLA
jgi:hypothetical protein